MEEKKETRIESIDLEDASFFLSFFSLFQRDDGNDYNNVTSIAEDLIRNNRVFVKINKHKRRLEDELSMIKSLRRFHNRRGVISFVGLEREELVHFIHQGNFYWGLVLSLGQEDMEKYFFSHRQNLNSYENCLLILRIAQIVSCIHESDKVWMDCKLSNVVYFPDNYPEWKGIDFEYTLDEGVEIPFDHGCTIAYAPPELVRYLFDEEGEKKGDNDPTLLSSKSMDMWSVGVCLLEIFTGEGLGENLELVGGKDRLREFYCETTDLEIQQLIGKMIMRTFSDGKYKYLRNLLYQLLLVEAEERLDIDQFLKHPFFELHREGTTSRKELEELKKMYNELELDQEEVVQKAIAFQSRANLAEDVNALFSDLSKILFDDIEPLMNEVELLDVTRDFSQTLEDKKRIISGFPLQILLDSDNHLKLEWHFEELTRILESLDGLRILIETGGVAQLEEEVFDELLEEEDEEKDVEMGYGITTFNNNLQEHQF